MKPSRDIADLIAIMARLRDPEAGCPWDIAQTFETIAPYTVEEANEVADAIARGDLVDVEDELGDLLLQVVFHARMAEECGAFDFGGVVEAITRKLIRRHPHVFGDARDLSPDEVKALWARIKAEEKAERAARHGSAPDADPPLLASVPAGLPPLARAVKLQQKASTVGFDWNDPRAVIAKIREELDEVEADLDDPLAVAGEIGDLMFAVVNLARHVEVDPGQALAVTNAKFERRFGEVERALRAAGRTLAEASLDEMEALWVAAKQAERT